MLDMVKTVLFLLIAWGNEMYVNSESVGAPVFMSVEQINTTSLTINWSTTSSSVTECALFVFAKGEQQGEILLLPSAGSIPMRNLTEDTVYMFSCTCFDQDVILKSATISVDTGLPLSVSSTTATYTQSLNTAGDSLPASNISSDVLTGAVFGCLGVLVLIFLCYIFYNKWRRDERLRAFLRLPRNNGVAPYMIFGNNGANPS
ncbi:uncharacterized protein LOC131713658 isoform X1 [Acipenser ruthenus]|uniref:uncharacterized protein LOC131713658 isoform X1 n=2 Tax=Acipenser ruthenus TaxID=7906 RepID=UPI0015619C54|nr:uncharacterized protein LOC131713658 isoform X1 [Acipenser ruthenus]